MVQAILDGRKTQTRRIAKFLGNRNPNWTGYIKDGLQLYNGRNEPCLKEPPYKVGDVLWVRETWATVSSGIIEYRATYIEPYTGSTEIDHIGKKITWRPSIHMPREAARIFLRVTNVRVERVQDISPKDCYAEGIIYVPIGEKWAEDGWAVAKYAHLWNKINEKRGCGWDTNPWVWVYEFEKINKE